MKFDVTNEFKKDWGGGPTFDELMALEGEMYRQVARRKTFKFNLNDNEYFAKVHKGVGWNEIFKNLLQGRKPVVSAANEYEAINLLKKLDVKTMTLAAYGHRGFNMAELESFVITESLEPAISLEDFCVDWSTNKPPLKLKRALIKRVAKITRCLHENGINHRDLYICHFLLKEGDLDSLKDINDVQLYLIDLHRVQIRSQIPIRWQVKDLAALYFSSMDIGLSRQDLFYFIHHYTGNRVSKELAVNSELWVEVKRKAHILKAKPIKD
ncbi:MAG: lipopolysaccharide core heptose(I) kinase RfaP [Cycloclasticus sp.]|nr:lipopolysaccharide core heptose(I) kinase RfaP [Cycloclasticus sp.]